MACNHVSESVTSLHEPIADPDHSPCGPRRWRVLRRRAARGRWLSRVDPPDPADYGADGATVAPYLVLGQSNKRDAGSSECRSTCPIPAKAPTSALGGPPSAHGHISCSVRHRLLTFFTGSLRLIPVKGVLAVLLIPAMIATSGAVASLHTHAYNDHGHPEHHHGLAAHEHHAVPVQLDDGMPHVEGCDPGKHAIPFAFVCAAPPQVHPVDAANSAPAAPTPALRIERAVRYTEVRVHGPPPRTQPSPRAPPLIAHA